MQTSPGGHKLPLDENFPGKKLPGSKTSQNFFSHKNHFYVIKTPTGGQKLPLDENYYGNR